MKIPNNLPIKACFADQIIEKIVLSPGNNLSITEARNYIFNSVNNFPKAIELLKEAVRFLNIIPNTRDGSNLSYATTSRIDNFLNSLENE